MPISETPEEARQGVTGHGVRYVLIVSFALAFIVLAGLLLVFAV